MAISSSTRKAGPFLGNDATTVFPFAFKVFTAADLRVVNTSALGVESDLVLDVDYTVSLNTNQDNDPGGSVTRLAALPTGEKLTITSDVEALQPLVLTNNGAFYPRVINDAFDKITIVAQQLIEQVSRSLKLPISSTASATLPDPVANSILAWNSDASGFVNIDPTDLATVSGYADARVETFNGDGVETDFEIDFNPGVLANLDVSISGITQVAGVDFTWIGTTVTFTSAPPADTVILVRYARPLTPLPDFDSILTSVADAEAAAALAQAQTDYSLLSAEASPVGTDLMGVFRSSLKKLTLTNLATFVVQTATVFIQTGTNAVAETIMAALRRHGAFPEHFGAVGDGVADDYLPLQRLHTAHKNVKYTRGATYRSTGEVVISTDTWINGNGAEIVQATDQTPIYDGRGCANVTVFGLKATGKRSDHWNNSNTLATCFRTDAGSDNWNVHHNKFKWFSGAVVLQNLAVDRFRFCDNDITGPGLVADGGPLVVPTTSVNYGAVIKGTNNIVCRNRVRDTSQGLFIGADSVGFQFDHNVIENTAVEHGFYGDTGIKDGSVSYNVIQNTTLDALKMQVSNSGNPIENVKVHHNVLRNITGNGLGAATASGSPTVFSKGLSYIGNLVEDCSGYGIVIRAAKDGLFHGNTLNRCDLGVVMGNSTNVAVTGNMISECQKQAFYDEAGNTDCWFNDNAIHHPCLVGGGTVTTLAVYLTAMVRGSVLRNIIRGDGTNCRYGIWVDGATDQNICDNEVTNVTEFGIRQVSGSIARLAGNRFSGALGRALGLSTTVITEGDWGHYNFTGDAAPTSGTYYIGSFVRNVDVAPGEPFGWYCTAPGSPGTWIPVGMYQSANAYTTANVTADRSFDADTVAVAELADVVGTLIADLKTGGILK